MLCIQPPLPYILTALQPPPEGRVSFMSPPLALRVVWFILTLTGASQKSFVLPRIAHSPAAAIPASWLVLIPFSMATGVWWAQILYGVVVTVMEGISALGKICKHSARSFPLTPRHCYRHDLAHEAAAYASLILPRPSHHSGSRNVLS